MITLSLDDVINIHDEILTTERGSQGYYGNDRLGGALGRIETNVRYLKVFHHNFIFIYSLIN